MLSQKINNTDIKVEDVTAAPGQDISDESPKDGTDNGIEDVERNLVGEILLLPRSILQRMAIQRRQTSSVEPKFWNQKALQVGWT
mmetsp:Transcript_14870/g.22997  ORF Transcript_14870/g.22997 Transcript_14870/m.22997 type:complete len:85 (-) Transcript_14870:2706-2960(-)